MPALLELVCDFLIDIFAFVLNIRLIGFRSEI
jgi:hypothetical protein